VYMIETGDVFAYDLGEGQFVSLAHYDYPTSETARRRRVLGTI